MIDLTGEPSLGSVVLTRDGSLKYSYILPRGMDFPAGASGQLRFTDRAGGEYDNSPFTGTVSADRTRITWSIAPILLQFIPAGANFEVFVTADGVTYKVRYGRVVRKEVSYPLNPLNVVAPPLMYEDDMQRSMPGPRWLIKSGRVSMQTVTGINAGVNYAVGTAMASRNAFDIFGTGINLFSSSATLWYAPLQTDNIEMSIGLAHNGEGDCTIVFASNYAMTKFLGVRFRNEWNLGDAISLERVVKIQVVYGTAWNSVVNVGSVASYTLPTNGAMMKIAYNGMTKSVSVFSPASATTPALTTSTASTAALSGSGFRYMGGIWQGTLGYTGPRMYYWKVKDVV
jgi:hypothetical protein